MFRFFAIKITDFCIATLEIFAVSFSIIYIHIYNQYSRLDTFILLFKELNSIIACVKFKFNAKILYQSQRAIKCCCWQKRSPARSHVLH